MDGYVCGNVHILFRFKFALTREVSPPLREGAPCGAVSICFPELRSVIGPRQGIRLTASRRRCACQSANGREGKGGALTVLHHPCVAEQDFDD